MISFEEVLNSEISNIGVLVKKQDEMTDIFIKLGALSIHDVSMMNG